MIAKDILLTNEWTDLFVELGVTKNNSIFVQNKSNSSVYLWPKNTVPDSLTSGTHLKVGDYITVDAQGDSLFARGTGYIYVGVVIPETGGPGVSDLVSISDGVGTKDDSSATTDTGSFSILSFIKRGLSNWTTLLSRIPALVAGAIPTTDTKGGTRQYDFSGNVRLTVGASSSSAMNLPTLYSSREVMVHASEKCFIKFGAAGVTPATQSNGHLIMEAGERFHLRLEAGITHFRVIRDTADGNLTITAVVQ